MMDKKLIENIIKQYERRWVALRNNEVIASDENVVRTAEKAKEKGVTEFTLFKVPSPSESFAP